jgi:hypothetical protein
MTLVIMLIQITGTQPWCVTDGEYFDCYYYSQLTCEEVAEQYQGRWCERNPDLYEPEPRH